MISKLSQIYNCYQKFPSPTHFYVLSFSSDFWTNDSYDKKVKLIKNLHAILWMFSSLLMYKNMNATFEMKNYLETLKEANYKEIISR